MKQRPRPRWALTALILAAAGGAQAGVTEKVQSAGNAASAAATKGENVVKKGASKAGAAIEAGAKKTGDAVSRTAKKLGLPTAGASSPGLGDEVVK
ncbi:hypothetical protein HLB44_04205 [Aquincola sp. S2]|uniref:ATP-binding protein n=1 Tax=Pseudaquabacterium terrae TaxID=2732868 RepID=A0ABX2EDE1_9BURK|nr:hypothetical protein [Aquabacterium terrae]NRF66178.1 hypothetical protein [Aquabacterium terrae]